MESLQAEQSHQGGLLQGLAAKLISRTDLIVTKQDQLHCAVVRDTITPPMTSTRAESKLTLSDYCGPQPPSRVSIGKPEQCGYGSSYQSDSLQYNFNIVFQDLGLADLFPEEVAKHTGTAPPISAGSGLDTTRQRLMSPPSEPPRPHPFGRPQPPSSAPGFVQVPTSQHLKSPPSQPPKLQTSGQTASVAKPLASFHSNLDQTAQSVALQVRGSKMDFDVGRVVCVLT